MKVICIGMPRTGTASICKALNILGYNSLHEAMFFDVEALETADLSVQLRSSMFKRFDDYDAITCAMYWRQICMAYPEAKIVLMTRDLDSWFSSIRKHIDLLNTGQDMPHGKECFPCNKPRARFVLEYGAMIHERLLGSRWPLRGLYTERFIEQQMAVTYWCEKMGREMLSYELAVDRWGPLCKFLGHPTPNSRKFPWANRVS